MVASLSAMGSGQERYYLELAREDYYLEGGEPKGVWVGSGAEALGLRGNVQREHLRSLMRGISPRDGAHLGQFQNYTDGRSRQPGWDLTFSAPKSVSVLWALSDEATQSAIQEAHFEAVQATIAYLEQTASFSRRGKGGERVEMAELVVATFEHGTSRAQDPQLHTHALLLNSVRRRDGTWGTVRSRDFYQHKMALGAIYRGALAAGLRSRLPVQLVARGTWFEVKGVPEELCGDLSTRRKEILGAQEEHGIWTAKAAEVAALATRSIKGHVARSQLRPRWIAVGEERGFGLKEAAQLVCPQLFPRVPRRPSLRRTVSRARDRLLESQSYFTERDLVRRSAEELQAVGFSVGELTGEVRAQLQDSQNIVALDVDALGYERFTTHDVLELEESLLKLADRSRKQSSHRVRQQHLEETLRSRPTIRDEQREALVHLTRRHGSVQCLEGMAGTGKTFLLGAAREAWERQGLKVLGCALSARAAHELESGSGIESRTLASLFWHIRPGIGTRLDHAYWDIKTRGATRKKRVSLDRNTVLVIDEAGMVGTRDMHALLAEAYRKGAKVVLVGDSRQLQPIDAGAALRALSEHLGAATLTEITRQRKLWMVHAVHQFAEGDARGALSQYAQAGRLHVADSPDKAISELARSWFKRRTKDLSETIILAGTNAEVDEINRRIQDHRAASGEVSPRRFARLEQGTFHEGDRVIFSENARRLGVLNGDYATIERVRSGVTGTRISVRLDRRNLSGDVEKPIRVVLTGREAKQLRLGYAVTVHKAQGATVERSFVLAGGFMQDRELAYVQMSRARGECRVFADKQTAGEDLSELAKAMSRSRQKDLALEHLNPLPRLGQ